MRAHVSEQVVDDLPQTVVFAEHAGRLEPHLDRPLRARPPAGGLHRFAHDLSRARPAPARAGRPSSRRASSSRSSTSTLIRSDSRLMPLIERSRSSGRRPRRAEQLGIRTDRGERRRSSCEASATKRRSLPLRSRSPCRLRVERGLDLRRASRSAPARAGRPPSARSARSTRRERSPAAIAAAVSPIGASGRSPRRTSQRPSSGDPREHRSGDDQLDHEQAAQRALDFARAAPRRSARTCRPRARSMLGRGSARPLLAGTVIGACSPELGATGSRPRRSASAGAPAAGSGRTAALTRVATMRPPEHRTCDVVRPARPLDRRGSQPVTPSSLSSLPGGCECPRFDTASSRAHENARTRCDVAVSTSSRSTRNERSDV